MKRIFKIKPAKRRVNINPPSKIRWEDPNTPLVKVRVDLLPKQRTSGGQFFITLGGVQKIVSQPVAEFYANCLYEVLNKIDFREISDMTISSSVTSYDGRRRKIPLLIRPEDK